MQKFTVLITGTNRGLGKVLALQLLEKIPQGNFLLTARKSPEQSLKESPQLVTKFQSQNLCMKSLDLNCSESVENFVKEVKSENWMFDAIVNNAAMGSDLGDKIPDPKWAKDLLNSNVVGTIHLTNLLLPNLKQNGRVVNVSSKMGGLHFHPQKIIDQFTNPQVSEAQILKMVEQYVARCEKGDLGDWFKSVYGTSKMLLNAWSRIILKRTLKPSQVSIAMSPGHCVTDMGGKYAANTAESGADTIAQCIFMENPSHEIFYHRAQPHEYIHCGPGVVSIKVETISTNK